MSERDYSDLIREAAQTIRRLQAENEHQSKHLESLQNRFAECTAENDRLVSELQWIVRAADEGDGVDALRWIAAKALNEPHHVVNRNG